MCCSLAPAHFAKTTVMAHLTFHPKTGEEIVVLGYQNTAMNLSPGPNAMLLHVPASEDIGPENMLDTSNTPNVLRDVGDVVRMRARGSVSDTLLGSFSAKSVVRIFEHGIYTVVTSNDIRAAHEALAKLDPSRRPTISAALVEFYATKLLTPHRFLFFCFNNSEAAKATPTLFWYKPNDMNALYAPGLDSHDGGAPDLEASVRVDHTVVFGHHALDAVSRAVPVYYSDGIPETLRPYLPTYVKGREAYGDYRNGDFAVRTEELLKEGGVHMYRHHPGPLFHPFA